MGSIARDMLALTLLGVAVLFTNLGGPRLWDRDEPRNAGCAVEMQARGEWIVPWFNGELRTHKPILLYWLILSAYAVFGVSEFSARFWSAALAIGTVLLTYGIGRRLADPRVGFWAGLILLSTLMFDVAARAATPDSVLIFCVTLALAAFVYGEFPGSSPALREPSTVGASRSDSPTRDWRKPLQWTTALSMYAAMGLAVLAKGPVGAILPTAVIGMYLLLVRLPEGNADAMTNTDTGTGRNRGEAQRGWRAGLATFAKHVAATFAPRHFLRTCWALRPLTAVVVILSIAAPWYVWVDMRTEGEFSAGFFWQHNVARAMSSFEGHHGGPWFYPVAISIGFFPWSVFAIPLAVDLWREHRTLGRLTTGQLFLLCWACVWIGLFTLASTKLPSYVTPAYPALAILGSRFVIRWSVGRVAIGPRMRSLPLAILALAGIAIAIGLPIAAHRFVPGAEWLGIIGAIPLAGAVAAAWTSRGDRPQWTLKVLATASVAFVVATLGVIPSIVDRQQRSHEILAAIEGFGADRIGAVGGLEPSWVFYGGRMIEEVVIEGRETPAQRSPFAPRPVSSLKNFLQRDGRSALIVAGRHWPALRDRYGDRLQVLVDSQKFLKNERLLAVAIADTDADTDTNANTETNAQANAPSAKTAAAQDRGTRKE